MKTVFEIYENENRNLIFCFILFFFRNKIEEMQMQLKQIQEKLNQLTQVQSTAIDVEDLNNAAKRRKII